MMMNIEPNEADSAPGQEKIASFDHKILKAPSSSGSAAHWLRSRDPRIVRVSRAFGGKDRHSKVCTIKGLRDRRVRLSVPTAIQLYDLQDRLGLSQPSKVVDWLLDAAKHEIDELPPLPLIQPGHSLGHLTHQSVLSKSHEIVGDDSSSKDGLVKSSRSGTWSCSDHHQEEDQEPNDGGASKVPAQNYFLSRTHLEPPNMSLLPNSATIHGFASQTGDPHHQNVNNAIPFSLYSGSSPIFPCPPRATAATTPPSHFPSLFATWMDSNTNSDPRPINHHFQVVSSVNSHNIRPSSLAPPTLLISASHPRFMRASLLEGSCSEECLHSPNSFGSDQPNKDP